MLINNLSINLFMYLFDGDVLDETIWKIGCPNEFVRIVYIETYFSNGYPYKYRLNEHILRYINHSKLPFGRYSELGLSYMDLILSVYLYGR